MPPGQRGQYGGNPFWINYPTVPTKKTSVVPPRIYEADIIRGATGIRGQAPALISPPALGTTSRAYANARGSQAGLNIPNSTYATQGLGGYAPAASNALGGGGGSGGGGGGGSVAPVDPLAGYAPDVADLSKNPIPGMYDQLLAYVKENADARPGIFQGYADKFKVNHEAANKQLYDAYLGSRTEQDAQATAFGVDPAIVAQARDLAMRRSQENSDQSLADNQAWLLKAGLLSQQEAQARGTQFAADKATKSAGWAQLEEERVAQLNLLKLQAMVDQMAAKSGGGGGGGGGRRGGGGSSKGSTGVTETDTLYNGGVDLAVYNELARTDKDAAAAYMNMFNTSSGTPGQKAAQTKLNQLSNDASYNPSLRNTAFKPFKADTWFNPLKDRVANIPIQAARDKSAAAKKLIPRYTKVLEAFNAWSGNMGNPKAQIVEKRSGRS
jgi:hypothetical protein